MAPQDQKPFLVSDLQVRDPIFIGVLRVVREQVHETVGVFVVIDGRFILGNIPLPADRSQIDFGNRRSIVPENGRLDGEGI